jgi:hypothetical protein
MPSLIAQSEEFQGKRFELDKPRLTLGRIEDNNLQVEHSSVSSHHAELVLEQNDYKVVDLESTNGTRVNGERVSESKLRRNDVVRFGNIDFLYDSEFSPPAAALPPPSEGLSLNGCGFKGRPAHFVSSAPFPKVKGGGAGVWKWILIGAAVFAVGGLGYAIYVMFLS